MSNHQLIHFIPSTFTAVPSQFNAKEYYYRCSSANGKYQTITSGVQGNFSTQDSGATWKSILPGVTGNATFAMSYNGQYQTVVMTHVMYTSNDYGACWTIHTTPTAQFNGVAMSQDGKYQTAFHALATYTFLTITVTRGVR